MAGRNRLSQNIASLYRQILQIYINFRGLNYICVQFYFGHSKTLFNSIQDYSFCLCACGYYQKKIDTST